MSEAIDERSKKILAIRKVLKDRDVEKQNANFAKADSMRDLLKEKYGVTVIDQKNGPSGFKFSDGSSNKLKSGYSELVPVDSQRKRKQDDDDNNDDKQTEKKKKQKLDKPQSSKIEVKKKDTTEQNRNKNALTAILGNVENNKIKNVQGVLIEDTAVGNGRKAESGNKVKVNYVGRLKSNNKVFDASKNRPFVFKLGRREVITGWDIGVVGMCVGGQRKLTIPPEKAYGKLGAPPTIPPNSTLIFDITLIEAS